MKAMILAAGKGERMRSLTDNTPKPLLKVKNKPLIQYTIERLRASGITDLVVNTAYLGEQVKKFLGDGSSFGVRIKISREDIPLETGGGIAHALPLLTTDGDQPFLLVNSDVWADIELGHLNNVLKKNELAHLVLVENPAYHSNGDFIFSNGKALPTNNQVISNTQKTYTYSGIAVLHPQLIKQFSPPQKIFPLLPLFLDAMKNQQISAEVHAGTWVDVGTPERLKKLNS